MAGADFDADDPSYGEDFLPEDIQTNLPGEEIDKSRLILERYIRDFSRSVEKKVIGLESALAQFEGKKAPGTKDFDELENQVYLMLERETSRLEKLAVQLEKEFDGIETRLKTQNGLEGDYSDIQTAKAELEALISKADEEYITSANAIIERGRQRIQQLEQEDAKADAEQAEKTRLILDRYINDMTKSFEKKLLATEMSVEAFGYREAPRTEDPQRLNELVDVMIKKQRMIIDQRIAQADKEYQALQTRLQTQGGTQADFDKAEQEYQKLTSVLTKASSDIVEAGNKVRERGVDRINDRADSRIQRDAEEKAQRAGEKVFEEYLLANKSALEPTLKEYITSVIGDVVGPYSAIRRGNDGRFQRREELLKEAEKRAAEEAQKVYDEIVDTERKKAGISGDPSLRLSDDDNLHNQNLELEAEIEAFKAERKYRTDNMIPDKVDNADTKKAYDDAYNDFLKKNPKREPEGFDFEPPRAPEGFQLKDLPSMARIIRGSSWFIAMESINRLNDAIVQSGENAIQGFTDPNQTVTQMLSRTSFGLGAFGSNVPINVGGKILEAIFTQTERVAENTGREVLPFSDMYLESTINQRLKLLEFNIDRADKVDPTLASITDSNTELKIAMGRLADQFLTEFGPALVGVTTTMSALLGYLSENSGVLSSIFKTGMFVQYPWMTSLLEGFWAIGKSKMQELEDQRNAMKSPLAEVEDFFNAEKSGNVPVGI